MWLVCQADESERKQQQKKKKKKKNNKRMLSATHFAWHFKGLQNKPFML